MRRARSGLVRDLLALRKEQDVFGNLAFWMLLVGGVAGAGTATYFVLVTRPSHPRGARAEGPPRDVAPGRAGALTGS